MASKLMAPGSMQQQQIKSDRSMFMTSDDNAMMKQSSTPQQIQSDRSRFMTSDDNARMKQIQATHAPDGREVLVDNKRILQLIEHIISLATAKDQSIEPDLQVYMKEDIQDKDKPAGVELVDKLSNEISSKCFGGGDGHETAVSLFGMLSSYSWEAKLVLTLAAFALNYGHFWLHAQIYTSNPLAKSMAKFRQLPFVMEHFSQLKPWFDAIDNLVKAMLDLTRCVVAFKELPSQLKDVPAALSAGMVIVPTAVYWIVRGIIACTNQIAIFNSIGHEFISIMLADTTQAGDLSTLAHKINNIHDHLKQLLNICYEIIEEKRNVEAYEALLNTFEMVHMDNMKVLKALIYTKDDLQPLFDGSSKRKVNLDILRRKNVLLLVSGLDISQDELSILEQIYNDSRQHATRLDILYEVVWIPIVDPSVQWVNPMQKQFESLQSTMPWYSVHHPSLIDQAVIRFIREKWHFRNKPILVVLDPQGRVVSPNAIHMMWIWGSNAFPFTSLREEALWKEETWRLDMLVNGIDPTILNWIREGKYIFLCGGDDIEWIRRFTSSARSVALASHIPLEMVYVGKSSKKEQVQRIIATINTEKLSYAWQDLMVWFFWTRLESMLFSKIQLGRADDDDPVMQETKKLLSYDKTGGWAVLSKGSDIVVNGHGTTVLPTLVEYDQWKEHVAIKGFDRSFKDHHGMIHVTAPPCCRFEFPSAAGRIPENMKCPECRRVMEKYTTFLCCHDAVKKFEKLEVLLPASIELPPLKEEPVEQKKVKRVRKPTF